MIKLDSAIENELKSRCSYDLGLSHNATKNIDAVRFLEEEDDIRPPFFHDTDRIIHSKAYARYIDKTQVFYLFENDHLTHRVLHVQLVSKIARTLGRILHYNEDLIEAIALGHDVGHTPFGHIGEKLVSDFCKRNNAGCFAHSAQSFRQFHNIEKKSQGINLCVQVLDGILCHNGEIVCQEYKNNKKKRKTTLLQEYKQCLESWDASTKLVPMSMEGCIVRISDIIAYVGRDIEDAITVDLIKRYDIPKDITDVLGHNNRDIINSLIIDIINHSFDKDSLSFSLDVYTALKNLVQWNYKNIYNNPLKTTQDGKIEIMFNTVLNTLLEGKAPDKIKHYYDDWLNKERSGEYISENKEARKVADYVSGMTDDFLLSVYSDLAVPKSFGFSFTDNFAGGNRN
ncbi:MAG: HD domain-containing protein [Spirochaetaceae bacterium]|jgi:dGTPase|nr:HD domain-containing protein [Spirochaetaceae bacterium]